MIAHAYRLQTHYEDALGSASITVRRLCLLHAVQPFEPVEHPAGLWRIGDSFHGAHAGEWFCRTNRAHRMRRTTRQRAVGYGLLTFILMIGVRAVFQVIRGVVNTIIARRYCECGGGMQSIAERIESWGRHDCSGYVRALIGMLLRAAKPGQGALRRPFMGSWSSRFEGRPVLWCGTCISSFRLSTLRRGTKHSTCSFEGGAWL